MIGIWRNSIQNLETLDRQLVYAAIDVGETRQELGDSTLYGMVVDEK
jgi:hypothetical protein